MAKKGPKPLPEKLRRSGWFKLRVNQAERRRILKAGGSQWVRRVILAALGNGKG